MNAERDLDFVLSAWVRAANPGPAPATSVSAALAAIERTPQPRRLLIGPIAIPMPLAGPRRVTGLRAVVVAAALVMSIVGLAVGAGAISRLLHGPVPSPTNPAPTVLPTADPSTATGRHWNFRPEGLRVTVPASWLRIGGTNGLVQFVAADGTTASIYHGDPYRMAVCDPRCETMDLPFRLPFDAHRVRADAMDRISTRVASNGGVAGIPWDAGRDLNSRLVDPWTLQVNEQAGTGQHAYLVASYMTELVVISVSTPGSERAAEFLDRIVESLVLYPGASVTAVGTPSKFSDPRLGFQVMIPDVWRPDAARPATGVTSFGGGRVQISVADADADGSMFVCDPTCRSVVAADLASLEAATFDPPRGSNQAGEVLIASSPGRFQVDTSNSPSYRAIAIVDGVPVHILIKLEHDVVARSVAEAIVASFAHAPVPDRGFVDGALKGNGYELRFDTTRKDLDISVAVGNPSRLYMMCTFSGWSTTTVSCEMVVGDTLEQMAAAVPFATSREAVVLDGEPAIVVRSEFYEYPARGGQWGAFIVALHDGRPFFIRIQSGTSRGLPVDDVLAGFRFTD